MKIRKPSLVLVALALSAIALGCNQRTQSLYKVEVERACQECDLRGVNLSRQSLGGKYRVSVSNQPLSTNPKGLGYAEPVNLTGSDMREANLSFANLSEVIFNDVRLNNADLHEANLRHAQFVGADLSDANLQGANLEGTNFRGANLSGADLRDTDLSTADLTGAELTGALRNEVTD